jgi:hypothetical protein
LPDGDVLGAFGRAGAGVVGEPPLPDDGEALRALRGAEAGVDEPPLPDDEELGGAWCGAGAGELPLPDEDEVGVW